MKYLKALGPLAAALFCFSCASTRQVEFKVNVINTEEKELPAVVFVDETLEVDPATNEPLRTPATVKVTFEEDSEGNGFASVKLGVKAVVVEEGKITSGLREGEASPYVEDWRHVYPNDSKTQLFILTRNKDYGG
jgi:hypothetical protein